MGHLDPRDNKVQLVDRDLMALPEQKVIVV
jgi:hypothetical protein